MRRVKSGEAMPMKRIVAAMVARMIRSRVDASGKRAVLLDPDFAEGDALIRPQQINRGGKARRRSLAHEAAQEWCNSENVPIRIRNSADETIERRRARAMERLINRKNDISTGIGVA